MESIRGSLASIQAALGAHQLKFDQLNAAAWSAAGALGLMALSLIAFLFVQVWPPDGRTAADPAPQAAAPAADAAQPT